MGPGRSRGAESLEVLAMIDPYSVSCPIVSGRARPALLEPHPPARVGALEPPLGGSATQGPSLVAPGTAARRQRPSRRTQPAPADAGDPAGQPGLRRGLEARQAVAPRRVRGRDPVGRGLQRALGGPRSASRPTRSAVDQTGRSSTCRCFVTAWRVTGTCRRQRRGRDRPAVDDGLPDASARVVAERGEHRTGPGIAHARTDGHRDALQRPGRHGEAMSLRERRDASAGNAAAHERSMPDRRSEVTEKAGAPPR